MYQVMFLLAFCLYSALQLLFTYSNVFGEEDQYHRHIIVEGFKPAIFGSYSYDPIKQEFDTSNREHNVSQIVNNSYVLSTAVGAVDEHNTTDAVYRHHVTIVTSRPTQWWARKLTKNMTKHSRF